MAGTKYKLIFVTEKGKEHTVEFIAPQGPMGPTGPQGPTGPAGPQGDAYVLTDSDRADIATRVLANFPTWSGGSY